MSIMSVKVKLGQNDLIDRIRSRLYLNNIQFAVNNSPSFNFSSADRESHILLEC